MAATFVVDALHANGARAPIQQSQNMLDVVLDVGKPRIHVEQGRSESVRSIILECSSQWFASSTNATPSASKIEMGILQKPNRRRHVVLGGRPFAHVR